MELLASYRFLLDCDTTEPANVLVTPLEAVLRKACDALGSTAAPVCLPVPACDKTDPASVLWVLDALPLCKVFPASDATGDVVFFVLLAI
uniref:hypothetical protein n=1 Tax=Hylemonella sp. TaxID=2066020 RepID=UPI0035B1506D